MTATKCVIRDIPVTFPFEPYALQREYMDKVIECLQTSTNGVLESPTGTGKTLSLLCASLAWLQQKKFEMQAQRSELLQEMLRPRADDEFMEERTAQGNLEYGRAFMKLPTIVYASRTHSQLSQAVQELKRTAYSGVKAVVIGSRDQLCINADVMSEPVASLKISMCRMKVQSKLCSYHHGVERKKDEILGMNVVDIEDMVRMGQQKRFCPYYMSRHLKQQADIIFMPYNYLLDPRLRKTNGVELANTVVILDEAHNVDKVCEESASIQIKSTDITLCVEELTEAMKAISEGEYLIDSEAPKDVTPDDLCLLKEFMLDFEKTFDDIVIENPSNGKTFEGDYIFELFANAGVDYTNSARVINAMEQTVQMLSVTNNDGGMFKKTGKGLDLFQGLLRIVFTEMSTEFRAKIKKCFKVHIAIEDKKSKGGNVDGWFSKANTSTKQIRVLNYWCFSPGFGMNMLKTHNGIKSIILTSGTLAPLGPLISELEMDVKVRLENPHIVGNDQVCVKILCKGPDSETLCSSYQNRDNPKYLASLGRTIVNLVRIIPGGLLIFFPSYPIMQNCQNHWQQTGIWSDIIIHKPIFVEPRTKNAFNSQMTDYYAQINNSAYKGAIFMGVCRGKVSEGLDFVDQNGRAVIITGLPFPPVKDPKVILKKRYLDNCHSANKEYLKGEDWYTLEATRAVNQAIGRVIRHKDDYGAILLLDTRFQGARIKAQLSKWLRDRIQVVNNFGEIVRDLKIFFRDSETNHPIVAKSKDSSPTVDLTKEETDLSASASSSVSNGGGDSAGLVTIHKKRDADYAAWSVPKKKKINIVPSPSANRPSLKPTADDSKEYIAMVRSVLKLEDSQSFFKALSTYQRTLQIKDLCSSLDSIFCKQPYNRHVIKGLLMYVKKPHEEEFERYCRTF